METSKILNKRQRKVITLRHRGFTWQQIADILNFNHHQQAYEIYVDSTKKLKRYMEIQHNCPELCLAFWQSSCTFYTLSRLYNVLIEQDLLTLYLMMDVDDLSHFPNIGPKSIALIVSAQDIYDAEQQKEA